MNLKNILIVVSDIDRSKRFYHDLFGLQVMRALPATMWNFFFEEPDWDSFMDDVDKYPETIEFIGQIRVNSWGKRAIILRDPDGHIIEVAEKK